VISVSNNYNYLDIEAPGPNEVTIDFDSPYPYQQPIPFLYSSAILGNDYWKKELNAKIVHPKEYLVRVTGTIRYDSNNEIVINEQGEKFLYPNSIDVDLLFAQDFEVFYLTPNPDKFSFAKPNETWWLAFELQEKSPSPTEKQSTIHSSAPTTITKTTEPIRTTRMPTTEPSRTTRASTKQPSYTTPATARPSEQPIASSDSYCSCDLDEDGLVKDWASQLWLD
ncbi:hypothetical protein PMAYCL1PPCAC_08561, partial [Pristionchus mayeri]